MVVPTSEQRREISSSNNGKQIISSCSYSRKYLNHDEAYRDNIQTICEDFFSNFTKAMFSKYSVRVFPARNSNTSCMDSAYTKSFLRSMKIRFERIRIYFYPIGSRCSVNLISSSLQHLCQILQIPKSRAVRLDYQQYHRKTQNFVIFFVLLHVLSFSEAQINPMPKIWSNSTSPTSIPASMKSIPPSVKKSLNSSQLSPTSGPSKTLTAIPSTISIASSTDMFQSPSQTFSKTTLEPSSSQSNKLPSNSSNFSSSNTPSKDFTISPTADSFVNENSSNFTILNSSTLNISLKPSIRAHTLPPTLIDNSTSPSIKPSSSSKPSKLHSSLPSTFPSASPSVSIFPSTFPTNSFEPSNYPTTLPTTYPTDMPSHIPSHAPSFQPSTLPSALPSSGPSDSPSFFPTTSPPSFYPTVKFSDLPTIYISLHPSQVPTLYETRIASETYSQVFVRHNNAIFENSQLEVFIKEYNILANNFINDDRVTGSCSVIRQWKTSIPPSPRRRFLQRNFYLTMVFEITYVTRYDNVDVEKYPDEFQNYMNNVTSLDLVTTNLNGGGLRMIRAWNLTKESKEWPSVNPSQIPTFIPTVEPSYSPSSQASSTPSLMPTDQPSPVMSNVPSVELTSVFFSIPSLPPSLPLLLPSPTPPAPSRSISIIITIAGVTAILLGVIIFTYALCKRKRRKPQYDIPDGALEKPPIDLYPSEIESHLSLESVGSNNVGIQHIAINYDSSFDSDSSLISAGKSDHSDLSIKNHSTSTLQQEFDQLHSNIINGEDNSMRRRPDVFSPRDVLLDKYNFINTNTDDYTWGGGRNAFEIEATALCRTSDWKKRQQGATEREKREFMKQNIERMIATVEHEIVSPGDGSRIIHECCALLGLPLEVDIPKTSLIVTGMVKTATSEDLMEGFKVFGEIEGNAVAGGERGFGIVRYKSPKSVTKALERFRTDQIIVQDVAVVIKMLEFEPDIAEIYSPRKFQAQGNLNHYGKPSHISNDTIGYPYGSIGRHGNGLT